METCVGTPVVNRMVEGSYDAVKDHLERLISSVQRELVAETEALGRLERRDVRSLVSNLIVADLVLANGLLCLIVPEYAIYWITASFFLYVINPFLLLVPSTGTVSTEASNGSGVRITERLGEIGLGDHRWLIARIFWNSYFINSQPLAPAFLAVYGLNIIFAFLGDFGVLGWLIIFQSAAIMLFYLAIAVFRPYTGGFLESLIGIQNEVYRKMHRHVEPLWKVMLPIGIAAGFVALILIAAMLLPGFTLGVIWNSRATVTGLGFIPVLFILVCQVILVRYAQGESSRRLARQLRERKVATLKKYVEIPLLECQKAIDPAAPSSLDRYACAYSDIRATFFSSRVYRVQAQDLAGYLPIWVVVPDLDMLLNPETIRILDERPDSRQII